MMKRSVFWGEQAFFDFGDAISELYKYPFLCRGKTRPGKIKRDMLRKIRQLSFKADLHPPDHYKFNNTGNFRAFKAHRFRVAYWIKKDQIIVTKIQYESFWDKAG
jgi:hypothetical protein